MSNYLKKFSRDVLGVGDDRSLISSYVKSIRGEEHDSGHVAGTVAGAIVGGVLSRHRVLGSVAGAAVGWYAPALFTSGSRQNAMVSLGQVGVGVGSSLAFRKHPVAGFVLGWLGAGAAARALNLWKE